MGTTDPSDETPQPSPKPYRGRWALWAFGTFAAIMVALSLLVYFAIGRPFHAPDWLHARIEAQLSDLVPEGGAVRFGDIVVQVNAAGRPRINLRDVEVLQDNAPILAVSELEAGFAAEPLLQGKLRLGRLRATGTEMVIRRRADGTFDLAFGASLPEVERAASVAEMIAGMDDLLLSHELLELEQIEIDALILRYEDLRIGRAWTIDGAHMTLDRDVDQLRIRGDLALLGGYDYATTVEVGFESEIGSNVADFSMAFQDMAAQDIAAQAAAVAWAEVLRAPVSGALRGSVDELGGIGAISGTLQIDAGVLQPDPGTRPIPFQSARSYFTYDPVDQAITFDELSVNSAWMTARAEGKALLQHFDAGIPQVFVGQFALTQFSAQPSEYLETPVSLDQAKMGFRLGLDPFQLQIGELLLEKQDQMIVVSGQVDAETDGWRVAIEAKAQRLLPDLIKSLWPEKAATKARAWVVKNIYDAELSNVQFVYRDAPAKDPDIYLGFEFDKAHVKYAKNLPAAQNGKGHASLENKRFAVTATAGTVTAPEGGDLNAAGTTFIIPDVTLKPTPAIVNIQGEGPLTAALSILNMPPLSILDKAGQSVDMATGYAIAQAQLKLPLKKKLPANEILFDATATLQGVQSTTLVQNRTLRARALDLSVTNDLLVIEGRGTLGGVPFSGVFEDDLRPEDRGMSHVYATAHMTPDTLDALGIALPNGMVRGAGTLDLEIALKQGQAPTFKATSDLRGLGLRIRDLGWGKAPKSRGTLALSGRLTQPVSVDSFALNAAGLDAKGRIELRDDGTLNRLDLDRVRLGQWLNAPVQVVNRGRNRTPDIAVRGGSVDLRHLPELAGAGGGSGGISKLDVQLDSLRINDTLQLTGVQSTLTTKGGMQGPFSGRVNGGAAVSGKLFPLNGKTGVEIQAANAGRALSDAGYLKQARDGNLTLRMSPTKADGSYNGYLLINQVRFVEVPALAALLHAVSIVGLLEQLGGAGIVFSEIEADFHLSPEKLTVRKSSAFGASMGISLDGVFDMVQKNVDFQGVLSPLYALNGVGSVLTRKGEGLLGFNFNVRGNSEKPRVQVNPLSIFTPGMFREIFRRPAPKVIE